VLQIPGNGECPSLPQPKIECIDQPIKKIEMITPTIARIIVGVFDEPIFLKSTLIAPAKSLKRFLKEHSDNPTHPLCG
jgi:hypothetical protein